MVLVENSFRYPCQNSLGNESIYEEDRNKTVDDRVGFETESPAVLDFSIFVVYQFDVKRRARTFGRGTVCRKKNVSFG